jgi:hypothetical protein
VFLEAEFRVFVKEPAIGHETGQDFIDLVMETR